MKKLTTLLAAALLAAACGKATDPTDQYRKALPTSDTLAISTARAGASAPTGLVSNAVTADGKSDLAVVSYVFATSVNGGVANMLRLIHAITWWPATSCDDNSCTWGPGASATDLNVFKLVVTKSGENYDYVLSAAPKSTGGTQFLPIVVGFAHKGALDHRGDGHFSVKFENSAQLDQPVGQARKDWGTLDVRYDTNGALKNEVMFWNVRDNDNAGADPANPNRLNVYFNFDASNANGDLLVAWQTQYAPTKELGLFTRWTADGKGRADLYYKDPATTHGESECWAGAPGYLQTYDNFNLATFTVIPDSPTNDPASCAFATADYHGFPVTLPPPLP